MKKIIGILGVVVFAITLFMNGTILFNNEIDLTIDKAIALNHELEEDNGATYRWRTMLCNSGGNYEMCSSYGRGDVCSPHTLTKGKC